MRFAPSPTGYLHIGNARTALFNWLFARKYRGKFILRIEDTDQERIHPKFEKSIIDNLHWLGLHWDEGPQSGGDFGPYRQSERRQFYTDAVSQLLQNNKAYHCYCTPEELKAQRKELLAAGQPPRYQGRCGKLTARQRQNYQQEGRRPSIRFRIEGNDTVAVKDLLRGTVTVEKNVLGDFIIMRSNGIAAYNLAVVVDDAMMRITHVLRGEDHLPNTPRQQLLYEALGHSLPQFVHLPMILGSDRTMLSKRHGATSVTQFQREGYLPQALVNYLALLGWSPGDGRELLTPEEMVEAFSLSRMAKGAAVFDSQKLNWLNAHYLKGEEIQHLTELCLPYLQEAGYISEPLQEKEQEHLRAIVASARPNLIKLNQVAQYTEVYFTDNFSLDAQERQIALEGKAVIEKIAEALTDWEELSEQNYKELIKNVQQATGVKGKKLYMPIRIALSGKQKGPEMRHLFVLLGKERCQKRFKNILSLLT